MGRFINVFTKLSLLRCPEFTPFYTITHISFKSSLSSNHQVCMPFLNTVLSSLSSEVTAHYTTRGQVNCPCKVFFSYLQLHLLLSYSLPVHVALLCGPRVRLACYLVHTSEYIHSLASRRNRMLPQPIHIAANSRSTFLLHKAQGLNSAVFCYSDI